MLLVQFMTVGYTDWWYECYYVKCLHKCATEKWLQTLHTDSLKNQRILDYNFLFSDTCLYSVVLWSDNVGDFHLWEGPIRWNTRHGSLEGAKERRETGETGQQGLS